MSVHEYSVKNKANDRGEIILYGTIGAGGWFDEGGVSAAQFAKDLKALGSVKSIDLRLNSEGGLVNDARAMYTLLTQHKAKVTVYIDGLAASAASFLAMAGEQIHIAESGFFMIHNARGVTRGTADDHEANTKLLRSFDAEIRKTYADRTGVSVAKVKEWMDAETWFTGAEAMEHGFASHLMENMRAAACAYVSPVGMGLFDHVPASARPNRAAVLKLIGKG